MVCPSCNTPNRDDAKFCKRCGQPLHSQQAIASETGIADDVQDISIAPTLILPPKKMIAYHTRRWQQELEQEQQSVQTTTAEDQAAPTTDGSSPARNEQSEAVDTAGAAEAIPPPPPQVSEEMPGINGSIHEEKAELSETEVTEKAPEQEKSEAMQLPSEQPDTTAPANEFPVLPVGTSMLGRYEITQVTSESQREHVYQVVDHQGYQHCWNCGSEQNAEGDEVCMECGAGMLNVPYTMHEYSKDQGDEEAGGHPEDSNVLQGTIVNTFIEQGHTYVIEQPQTEQQ